MGRDWLLTGNTWKTCLWAGLGFVVIAAFSLTLNLVRETSGLPWFHPALMLLLAAVWFVRSRFLYLRSKKSNAGAGEEDSSSP